MEGKKLSASPGAFAAGPNWVYVILLIIITLFFWGKRLKKRGKKGEIPKMGKQEKNQAERTENSESPGTLPIHNFGAERTLIAVHKKGTKGRQHLVPNGPYDSAIFAHIIVHHL